MGRSKIGRNKETKRNRETKKETNKGKRKQGTKKLRK